MGPSWMTSTFSNHSRSQPSQVAIADSSSSQMMKWTDELERIMTAVEARRDQRAASLEEAVGGLPMLETTSDKYAERQPCNEGTLGGPLTSKDISELALLRAEITCNDATRDGFKMLDPDMLINLSSMLEAHVTAASSIDLIRDAKRLLAKGVVSPATSAVMDEWLKGVSSSRSTAIVGPGVLRYLILRNGLYAATILLSMMSTPGIDRRVVNEDFIESCILLLRHHLTKNIAPMLTKTTHLGLLNTCDDSNPSEASTPTTKKRRRSGVGCADQGILKELKKIYKPINASIPILIQLFEVLENIVYSVQMDDQQILTLSSTAMSVFGIDPYQVSRHCHSLYLASIGLLTAISQRYPMHRGILVEDLFPALLRIPSSKKSVRTFPVRSLPPFSPLRKISPFAESKEEEPCIQAISVLIVSLIHSCVQFPTYDEADASKALLNSEAPSRKSGSLTLKSGVIDCQTFCDQLVAQLLQRCSRKGEDGGASEFRPVLSCLVDDLLMMQLLPEHPGAEMLLMTLLRGLTNDVMKCTSLAKTSPTSRTSALTMESTYLSVAFDVLGNISSSLAAILASRRERPLSIVRHIQDIEKAKLQGRNVNSCFCGRFAFVDSLMVSCDTCQGFFHGECIGVNQTLFLEGRHKWQCDDCKLKSMALEETKVYFSRRDINMEVPNIVPHIVETQIFRQLVLTSLSDAARHSPGVTFARQFLLAMWVKDLCAEDGGNFGVEPESLARQFLDLWHRPHANNLASEDLRADSSLLNKDGYHRLMIALAATKSELVSSFPRQMGLLIRFMGDESFVSIRKLAVKAVAQVVDADSTLMLHPAVKSAVVQRLADEAKSVREAVVGLVGSFITSFPDLTNAFHSSFLALLQDEGVSVKKRTVKIFRDILITNPNYAGRAVACAVMLKRAADPKEDDSVRDLIHELFTEIWLENSEISPIRVESEEKSVDKTTPIRGIGGSIVTPIASPDKPNPSVVESLSRSRCSQASEQMLNVVLVAGSNDMLTGLLKVLLCDFADNQTDRKQSDRRKRKSNSALNCANLIDALVNHLLRLEESRGDDEDTFGRKLVATIRTLGSFSHVAPYEVSRHVDTLLPYIKAENRISASDERSVVSEVCDIICRTSRVMSKGEVFQLTNDTLSDDLVRITYRLGSHALASAVRTLCELAAHPYLPNENLFRRKAVELTKTFYGYLYKNTKLIDENHDQKTKCNIQRALSVLGCLCKSHAVENDDNNWIDGSLDIVLASTDEVIWDTMVEACYNIFMFYLRNSDVETKCSSIRALGGIFSSRPRVLLAMQQSGSIDAIMAPTTDPELQLQALRCWREILLAEENRVESGEAKAQMESKKTITVSNKISGDQDSDATIVGGVLICHSQRLHDMTTDKDQRIRCACVELLSHLLRQGLLNPFQTIPYLFGLQGDIAAPDIRELALKLLIQEGEKRPDLLRQRICAGVINAYLFQREVYPDRDATSAIVKIERGITSYECIFDSVFKECIRSSKKQKQGLFTNLLGLFDIGECVQPISNAKGKEKVGVDIPLLSFTAEMLAYLPYNTASDPLFIIYHIQCLAAIHGAQHLDNMISFLQRHGFPIDANDISIEEDDLEIAAKTKHPSRAEQGKLLMAQDFDLIGFEKLCEAASSFVLLLRLKAHLRKVYSLSETRCLVYSPDGTERNIEKVTSTTSQMPRFESKIPVFFPHGRDEVVGANASDIDRDALILLYAEFRRLLRQEQSISSRISAMDDNDDRRNEVSSTGAQVSGVDV